MIDIKISKSLLKVRLAKFLRLESGNNKLSKIYFTRIVSIDSLHQEIDPVLAYLGF